MPLMSLRIIDEYFSIGGNLQSAASAWSRSSGALAFGANQNVALWYPSNKDQVGVKYLLSQHEDKVTALAFLEDDTDPTAECLISGSSDGYIVLWLPSAAGWQKQSKTKAHNGAVNVVACLQNSDKFVTGGADAELKVWTIHSNQFKLIAATVPKPRIIPLAIALGYFPNIRSNEGCFMAVGGTRNDIQAYSITFADAEVNITLQATLKGHEGWIRSLTLERGNNRELMLASASADKYVRLWKFSTQHSVADVLSNKTTSDITQQQILQAKVQTISVADSRLYITFEALLLGHEDWVYSASFSPRESSNQLLTASADGTLAIWEPDPVSGIWISTSKLGEISGQKGATTATGSSGGFWTALWSPDGYAITCLGRTGSWRIWNYDSHADYWVQRLGISGHTNSVNSLAWPRYGQFLLSTSSDQTTRLHAEWRRNNRRSWHEFSRPQIHGYDLNCISLVNDHQFASGADEKLLRVFNEPKDIARMLELLSGIEMPAEDDLPDMAAIPVLGLSNKSIGEEDDSFAEVSGKRDQDYVAPSVLETSLAQLQAPPNEDVLARHTLWPEHEKLYGHGYEISQCAASDDYLATVCKASSTDHAVIRLYDTKTWSEIKPPLQAHSLTVTRLAWSESPDDYLISVGRDRQWAVFGRDENSNEFKLLQCNAKAHTRMILDAAWSPVGGKLFFATAGRDKMIKIWRSQQGSSDDDGLPEFTEQQIIKQSTSVTAISFTCNNDEDFAVLAAGEESGKISIHVFSIANDVSLVTSIDLPLEKCPGKTVNCLAWRDNSAQYETDGVGSQLAIAAADGSVRILGIDVEGLCTSLKKLEQKD